MKQYTEIFVGLDVAKARHAVAVAEDGRQGEVRYLGEIGADKESVRRLVAKLERRHGRRLHFCYEAGPTGYGLSAIGRTGVRVYGRRALTDPAQAGRPGQDQSA